MERDQPCPDQTLAAEGKNGRQMQLVFSKRPELPLQGTIYYEMPHIFNASLVVLHSQKGLLNLLKPLLKLQYNEYIVLLMINSKLYVFLYRAVSSPLGVLGLTFFFVFPKANSHLLKDL
jgi:hypothetical protein